MGNEGSGSGNDAGSTSMMRLGRPMFTLTSAARGPPAPGRKPSLPEGLQKRDLRKHYPHQARANRKIPLGPLKKMRPSGLVSIE
jgi:hypothetical protein